MNFKKLLLSCVLVFELFTGYGQSSIYFNNTYDFYNQWETGFNIHELDSGYIISGGASENGNYVANFCAGLEQDYMSMFLWVLIFAMQFGIMMTYSLSTKT